MNSHMLASLGRWFKSGSVDVYDLEGYTVAAVPSENVGVGSGIRTHAHIRGPECSLSWERLRVLSLAP